MGVWVISHLKVSPWPLGPGFHDQAVLPPCVPRSCTLHPRYRCLSVRFFWQMILQLIVKLPEVTATFVPCLPGVWETSVRYLPIKLPRNAWDLSLGCCTGSWSLPEDNGGNGCLVLLAWHEGHWWEWWQRVGVTQDGPWPKAVWEPYLQGCGTCLAKEVWRQPWETRSGAEMLLLNVKEAMSKAISI